MITTPLRTIVFMPKPRILQTIEERALIVDSYPGWHETQKFTSQVRSSVVASKDVAAKFPMC